MIKRNAELLGSLALAGLLGICGSQARATNDNDLGSPSTARR
jgi:hypothetical protein